ncbi:tRNA 5-methoxyuridine(34)/uridine 5-oxyacetic acid(34) synthase CmoB [Candidatus Electrothrix sp.]|uniref:tRNA 5-methoxyuridine(34)/uridine 5-oxyacetic acid(34) synthase CmoB n=1 Tax=Candidatus Electrothrix sp. TaxID=2170559 RepID=UPI0040562D14
MKNRQIENLQNPRTPPYLHFLPNALGEELQRVYTEKQAWVNQPKKGFLRYREPMEAVAHLRASSLDCSGDTVRIGKREDLSDQEHEQVLQLLKNFMPWRKGPFSVFDINIDAEWQSWRKWNRLLPEMPDLKDKVVADIGCNNGYYMFRMTDHAPRFVLGFEPYVHHYYTFKALNSFAGLENLCIDLLGIEHLPLFPTCFDVILCLGILYHRPSPIDALRDLLLALKPGGCLLLESQAIPGEESVALFPEKTYAKVPGTWFVPTAACLHNWLQRAGFSNIKCFCSHSMSSTEQRKTDWMVFESYQDFIDKQNPEFTIEGYPAPWRVFFKAEKKP